MMQGLQTKFQPASETRGPRVLVRSYAKRKSYAWDYELSDLENHVTAAALFVRHMGWDESRKLIAGGSPDGFGYLFVMVENG